jgi:hypothetical protein
MRRLVRLAVGRPPERTRRAGELGHCAFGGQDGEFGFRSGPNLGPSLSVGDDDAIPSKKICPCPGTHWACDGRSGKRIVCCRPCGVKHRSVHVRGFYSHDDDWWRSWVLPGNRCSASGFSCTIWSACKRRLQRQGRFCRIPQRRRHVSRYIDGFCVGHRYRAS